eukprot:gene20847-32150_t
MESAGPDDVEWVTPECVALAAGALRAGGKGERTVGLRGCVVVRRKELSRYLCLLTVLVPGSPGFTVSNERSTMRRDDILAVSPPVGAVVTVVGLVEKSNKGKIGIASTVPPSVTGTASPRVLGELDTMHSQPPLRPPSESDAPPCDTQTRHAPASMKSQAIGSSRVAGGGVSLCRKHWAFVVKKQGLPCANGDACRFRHDISTDDYARVASDGADGVHGSETVAAKRERFTFVARWLLETYGAARLRSGPVVDVAGGKGILGLCLDEIVKGVATVVVDPNDADRGSKHRQRLAAANVKRIKTRLDVPDVSAAAAVDVGPPDLRSVLQEASVIVGIHPDQATDHLVRAALLFEKPFAIIPCCVFPTVFSERRLASGGRVETHSDLLAYLSQLAASRGITVRTADLPFVGKNRALYAVPVSAGPSDLPA